MNIISTCKLVLTIYFISLFQIMTAQELDQHRWKNRILIVQTGTADTTQFEQQLHQLIEAAAGLIERKLVVYQVKENYYKTGLSKEGKWMQTSEAVNPVFKVTLIGLDGGIKLRQYKILTTKKLFELIDSMPMRIREMRNSDQDN